MTSITSGIDFGPEAKFKAWFISTELQTDTHAHTAGVSRDSNISRHQLLCL